MSKVTVRNWAGLDAAACEDDSFARGQSDRLMPWFLALFQGKRMSGQGTGPDGSPSGHRVPSTYLSPMLRDLRGTRCLSPGRKDLMIPITCGGPALTVLIADGHEDGAETLACLLRMHGHVVTVARTGPAALAAAARTPPDVFIVQPYLRGLSGWEGA